jgi:hypothetical protein
MRHLSPFTFALAALCFLSGGCGRLPSDVSLLKNFYPHEGEFNQLVQMAKEDSFSSRLLPRDTQTEDERVLSFQNRGGMNTDVCSERSI